jgi:hypothetical protein
MVHLSWEAVEHLKIALYAGLDRSSSVEYHLHQILHSAEILAVPKTTDQKIRIISKTALMASLTPPISPPTIAPTMRAKRNREDDDAVSSTTADFAQYCFFCKLKHFRAIATRYDKLARNFQAAIQFAGTLIWLRAMSDQVEQGTSRYDRLCRGICSGCMCNLIGHCSN